MRAESRPLRVAQSGFPAIPATQRRAAVSDAVLLLRARSGSGKNVLARWIRANSPRAEAPFVTVNCPALSRDLMTSALFGHRHRCLHRRHRDVARQVQEAENGTLLLDEVGELTADAQAKLLRFLNDRTYERLGEPASVRPTSIDRRDETATCESGGAERAIPARPVLSPERRHADGTTAARAPLRHSVSSRITTCRSSVASNGGTA
jgi:transcriptional regulator with AAA-type ATPase domain